MNNPFAEMYKAQGYPMASVSKGKLRVEGWHNTEDGFLLFWDGFDPGDQDRLELMIAKDSGLTGTGWYGELRDMIAQLSMIAGDLGVEVEIPPETQRAMDEEDRVNPLTLPEGGTW